MLLIALAGVQKFRRSLEWSGNSLLPCLGHRVFDIYGYTMRPFLYLADTLETGQ